MYVQVWVESMFIPITVETNKSDLLNALYHTVQILTDWSQCKNVQLMILWPLLLIMEMLEVKLICLLIYVNSV